jgi:hypothetical protein
MGCGTPVGGFALVLSREAGDGEGLNATEVAPRGLLGGRARALIDGSAGTALGSTADSESLVGSRVMAVVSCGLSLDVRPLPYLRNRLLYAAGAHAQMVPRRDFYGPFTGGAWSRLAAYASAIP